MSPVDPYGYRDADELADLARKLGSVTRDDLLAVTAAMSVHSARAQLRQAEAAERAADAAERTAAATERLADASENANMNDIASFVGVFDDDEPSVPR